MIDRTTVFAGDVAYNGMHAYLADGRTTEWLAALDRLATDLDDDAVLYVGHGEPGGKELLRAQREYVETFLDAVSRGGRSRSRSTTRRGDGDGWASSSPMTDCSS